MKLLIPVVLLLVGLAAGAGAGLALRPAAAPADAAPHTEHAAAPDDAHSTIPAPYQPRPEGLETVRLPNQFVIPLIEEGRVRALAVIGLALEILPDSGFSLSDHEPRLRAVFLQVLFDHANAGGFDGVFTSGEVLLGLRRTLRETAIRELGSMAHDVLITELLRQESG